ncbi:hypothetical protein [Micromonospora sp. DT231]
MRAASSAVITATAVYESTSRGNRRTASRQAAMAHHPPATLP